MISVCLALNDWVQVDQSYGQSFSNSNNWHISKYCDTFNIDAQQSYYTCTENHIKYVQLKKDNQRIDKIFPKKSYQQQVIFDIFFDDADSSISEKANFTLNLTISQSQRYIMEQRSYIKTDLTQQSRRICNTTGTNYFEFQTIVGTSQVQYYENFNISIGIDTFNDLQVIGVRNLFVYVKYCLPTCNTCSTSTSCLSCYYGSPQVDGTCNCDPSHQFAQTGVGCRQECDRNYYMARSDNVCIPEQRIISYSQYFYSQTFSDYSPFEFIGDILYPRTPSSLIIDCCSTTYVGGLVHNEGMSFDTEYVQHLKFIRLRVTFFIKNFLTDSKIQIKFHNQIQGEIIKTDTNYYYYGVKLIYNSSTDCSTYDLIRIEAILRMYSPFPKLTFQGVNPAPASQEWGFRNLTIDYGYCQMNCLVCDGFSTCAQCDGVYKLFQKRCVDICPIHSINCIDYADIIPNSRYLAKGFYNLNMTTTEISQFYDTTIETGSNFLTGQKFSIFPYKFVLGGVMVWNNAIYKKQWIISKPHYAVTIRFNVTYGDLYTGNFYYTIEGVKSTAYPKPTSGGYNIIGKISEERTLYFEIFQNPFKQSTLDIELQCTDTTSDPRDEFCAISEYFIVVHYCQPFCQDCNDGNSCVTWESGHTSSACLTNQFLQFNPVSESYSCITCNQPGCLACKNMDECTQCDTSSYYNYLENGWCISINPSVPRPPIQTTPPIIIICNKYCETCTGSLQTNCQSCVIEFHRYLYNNECICQPGFYDDGINILCLPVCGDLIIVEGEDCDDGNHNPYDGCNNCKFDCDEICNDCFQGFCFNCKKGFQLVDNNKCISICGDNLLVKTEECEDNNQIPNDGCYNCKFQCPNNYIDCQFNQCIKCDEQNGWYLKNNTCQTICGNTLNIYLNTNNIGYDLLDQYCFQYLYICQDTCSTCYNGKCYQCNEGWILNIIDRICYPINGDTLIVGNEQCDDGNQIVNDGCFQSQFQCQLQCELCLYGQCQKCKSGFIIINNICQENNLDNQVVGQEQCNDQNLIGLDGCFQNRFDCPQFCLICVMGQCLECNITSGYGYIDKLNNKCLSICGDGIKSMEEDCDDRNEIPNDGCFQCHYYCDQNCFDCRMGICYSCYFGYYLNQEHNSCYSICGDGIIASNEQCDDLQIIADQECLNCQLKCQKECVSCYEGKCYACEGIGWEIDLVSTVCRSNCGDGIIVGKEQCEDGNEIDQDGCYQCEFQCQQQCTKCLLGDCLECNSKGWYLYENYCISECGDQIVVKNEQCDDGNDIPYDGCYECQFQCQVECTDCKFGICYECGLQGWHLINNRCNSICGDRFVVQDLEQCDDGNLIQYDGCYECKFQCQEVCTLCKQGICYECDVFGWILDNHICKPFCGDGIIIDHEQCDDMNDNQNDGCHNCLFLCDQYCIDCYQGQICQKCEIGRQLYYNACIAQCGDGYYVKSVEDCDDGNHVNGDGCNIYCQIETDYQCQNKEGSYSLCVYQKLPQFEIKLLPIQVTDIQDIQVKFDQKMKYLGNSEEQLYTLINSTLLDMQDSDYKIIQQLQNNEQESEITIKFKVYIYVPIDRPILKIQFLNESFVSQQNLPLLQSMKIIPLLTPTILSQTQVTVAQNTATFNEAVIYFQISLSSLCLMTGSSELFWNLMDQLQYLSYIKYINIRFPPNLNIYFDVFKMITINPLIQAFGIDKLLNLIQQGENKEISNNDKFFNDDISVNFLDNFNSFLFCSISAYTSYLFVKYSHIYLYRINPQTIKKMNLTVAKIYIFMRKKFMQQSKQFYYNVVLRIFMSSAYDIAFAMTIQLAYFQSNNLSQLITSYASLIVFSSYLGISIYIFNLLQKFSNSNTLKIKQQYEALFEGTQNTQYVWIVQYNSILLLKKFIFICIIVFMQTEGKLQTMIIASNQTLFLLYFISNKPLKNIYEYYKMIITESIIIFNTISFFFYDYLKDIGLHQNFSITLGWVHIFTFSAILSFSLIIDVFLQSQVLLQKLKKFFCDNKKKETSGTSQTIFI
ncbi:unnamed protein product [Paramecium primaurelia]|uniref:EGF-like domain-containing protein n=1 Tax=Paramecium primaurelia TaxID=5886 RepID=A0A8S1N101_PARPR|nr:unnamed protein product [Paramecium primaurelia]